MMVQELISQRLAPLNEENHEMRLLLEKSEQRLNEKSLVCMHLCCHTVFLPEKTDFSMNSSVCDVR